MGTVTKRCTKCRRRLPIDCFYIADYKHPLWRRGACIECVKKKRNNITPQERAFQNSRRRYNRLQRILSGQKKM